MKKLGIMIMTALVACLTSCEDKTTAEPQYNEQEPVMGADAIAVQIPSASADAVNLGSYNSESGDGMIPVLQITKLDNFPEYYTLEGVMHISADADFSKECKLDLTYSEGMMYANVAEWESAHLTLFSKNPRTAASYVKFALYGVNGTTVYRLADGNNVVFGEHKIDVTPLPAQVIVEEQYSIVGDVEAQMNASNPDDVYDPPTFSAQVTVTAGSTLSLNIRSASGKVYGQDPNNENGLVQDGAPIVLSQVGPLLLTVNMEDLTYEVSMAIEAIYAYGSSPSGGYQLTTNNYVNYKGFAGLNLGYFRLADATKGYTMRWGQAVDADGEELEGKIELQESPSMIKLEHKGCHYLDVNLSALTYSAYYVESFGLIGGWDSWSTDVVMTATDKYCMVWTADLTITDGTEFKIRTNGDWDGPDLGVADDFTGTGYYELQDHGSNIVWNLGDGTFKVTLDLSKVPYTLKAVKK